jgi:hypothetical protein
MKIFFLENSVALNHINEDHTLLRKSLQTHALLELVDCLKIKIKNSSIGKFLLANYLTL